MLKSFYLLHPIFNIDDDMSLYPAFEEWNTYEARNDLGFAYPGEKALGSPAIHCMHSTTAPIAYRYSSISGLYSMSLPLPDSSSFSFHSGNLPSYFKDIITQDSKMLYIFRYIESICRTFSSILIIGETGTGKELLAEAVHKASGRPGKFIAVNIAGLDDTLFTDTLFGHVKGAFTGADKDRQGLVEQASEGTLFIDEIGDVNMQGQEKLLRFLEKKEYYPLGSDKPKISNAKIIAATNKDIINLIKEDKFKLDLFYRLNTYAITLPPLRERRMDIPLLINFFIEKLASECNKKKPKVPQKVSRLLSNQYFLGNVRELRSIICDAVIVNKQGRLSIRPMKYIKKKLAEFAPLLPGFNPAQNRTTTVIFPDILPTRKQMELMLLAEALKRTNNNKTKAARLLAMSRQGFIKALKKNRIAPVFPPGNPSSS